MGPYDIVISLIREFETREAKLKKENDGDEDNADEQAREDRLINKQMLADDSDIRLDLGEKPEFDRWRWVDYWRPVKEVVYFKRQVYASALAELAPLIFTDEVPPQPRWWPGNWSKDPMRTPAS